MDLKLALNTLVVISLLVVMTIAPARSYSQTTIHIAPSTIRAAVGQTFFISINISVVIDLYGWEFKLGWNSTLLDALNVTEGDFLKSGGDTFFQPIINNTAGRVLVDCTLLGSTLGVSGSGTLAIVEFRVESAGESVLDLYDTKLVNSLELPITHQSIDGYGYFTFAHDVAIIDIIASPITVLPGQYVQINASVENQGFYAEDFNVTAYYNSEVIQTQSVSLDPEEYTVLTFTWDTTGVGKGDYTISAKASIVPGETETTDNTKVADGVVTVLSLGHDVAIKGVTPSKTIVGQGYAMSITVTAKNYGSFTETFNVTTYYNDTAITLPDGKNYATITLTSGGSATVAFTWDTAGVAKGNYTIKAEATPVPGETDTLDNTYDDGWVVIALVGDINADGVVDITDIYLIALAFGAMPPDPRYDPNLDIVYDEIIDVSDVYTAAMHFGETDP